MKVKLFTHTDLDGVGCAVVGKHAFGDALDVEYCDYHEVNQKVKSFLESDEFDDTDVIFITDISVNDTEVINLINHIASDKLLVIDHHATAESLNQFSWARVSEYEDDPLDRSKKRLSSGTSAFFFYLVKNKLLKPSEELLDFVEQVRSYDSWDWTRVQPKNILAYQLNMLLTLVGRYKFVERFSENPEVVFNSVESTLLEVEQKRMDLYIKSKKKKLKTKELHLSQGTYKVGYVFAENYISELGNELGKENPDLDFIVMLIGSDKLSFRRPDGKDHIDLGKIAKEFGGGGHPTAAGANIPPDKQLEVLRMFLE